MYRVCKPKPALRDDKARSRTCSQLEDAAERAHSVVVLMLGRRGGCLATGSSSCSIGCVGVGRQLGRSSSKSVP